MAKVVNFGSMNLDYVYTMDRFVISGETVAARRYERFAGGKGLNQSIALARAGCEVHHVGKVGADGRILLSMLQENGVNPSLVRKDGSVTGHAIIQVDGQGSNGIIIHGGANREITGEQIAAGLDLLEPSDIVLLQNEINGAGDIMEGARKRGARVALNPSPIDSGLQALPIHLARWLILNEIEGASLCGCSDTGGMADALLEKYPDCAIVLTLGDRGVVYRDAQCRLSHGVYDVPVADTTGAGDTFVGFFLASIIAGLPVEKALENASRAAALAVSRAGAAQSVPTWNEVAEAVLVLQP